MDVIKPIFGKQDMRLFINYMFFGGIAALVDLGLLFSLTEFLGIWYLFSAGLSYIAGMATDYSLNKYLNFKNKSKKIAKQFGLFVAVAMVGLALNQMFLFVFVEFFGLWYMLAKMLSILIVVFWNFNGHKRLTFGILK